MTTSEQPVPSTWNRVQVEDSVSLAVPPDAVPQSVQPIDSEFGLLRGPDYEIAYDYGRAGDDLEVYAEEAGFRQQDRKVGGHQGSEISFRQPAGPWPLVRLVQVQHGTKVLTVRIACADEETCRLAPILFDSVRLT